MLSTLHGHHSACKQLLQRMRILDKAVASNSATAADSRVPAEESAASHKDRGASGNMVLVRAHLMKPHPQDYFTGYRSYSTTTQLLQHNHTTATAQSHNCYSTTTQLLQHSHNCYSTTMQLLQHSCYSTARQGGHAYLVEHGLKVQAVRGRNAAQEGCQAVVHKRRVFCVACRARSDTYVYPYVRIVGVLNIITLNILTVKPYTLHPCVACRARSDT